MYIYPLKAAHGDALIIRFFAKTSLRTLLPQDDKKISQNGNDIMAYLIEWRQLVRCNKEKLSYASTSLKMNKMDVESTFM